MECVTAFPRVVGRAEQFEDPGDRRAFAPAETDFHALTERQSPCGRNFVAQCGDDRWCGLIADLEIEVDLLLTHAAKGRLELPKVEWSR